MKRLIFLLALFAFGGWSAAARAQKPRLNETTFRIDGKTVTCTTGEVRVAVTMVFNTTMRDSIPVITFGLNSPYPAPLPLITKTWVNSTTFVASFDINNRVPPTADGLYKFLIRQAYAAGGDTLAPVLSDTVKNGSNQPSTLYISRTGKLTATASKVDFGAIKAGAAFDKTLVLRNATCAEVFLTRFTLSEPFTLLNPPVGAKVAPDANLTLNLRFSSLVRKAYAGVIKINYTSNSLPDSLLVQLAGIARGPEMVFIPTPALSFGSFLVGDSAAKSFLVTNHKADDEKLTDTLKIFSAGLNPIAGYNLIPPPAMIAPGDTKSVTIKFKPTEGRVYNSSLNFSTNDLIKPLGKISFPVSGIGQILTPPPRIDTLLVTWPGGRAGYTNADSLTIYLNLTVASVAKVQDARWKFSFLPSAPTTPSDTTGTAQIFIVSGRPCFKIPLRNVLSAGRWNCYVWLQGRNGVSGYLTPNYATLNYDITAPAFTTLPSVTAGWTGGFVGYTNGDSLTLCWEAADPSGITEIRWKFLETTKPINEPGQFSRRTIGDGKFCLTLPLKNNIAPNQWYLYLWLVDGSGNSGYVSANAVYFKYDLTAPLAPSQLVDRNIGPNEWFNTRRSPLRLALGLFDGIRDAARVRWKFQTPPGANTAFDGESALVRNGNNVNFSVAFNSASLCGFDSLFYWLVDSAGNVNALASAFAEYSFDACPPVITRFRSGEALANKRTAFSDTVRIFDHTKIVWDSVTYRFGGARATEPPRRLRRVANSRDLFALDIPADGVTTRGLEYKVFAKDSLNNPYGAGPAGINSNGICGDDNYYWQAVRVRTGVDGEFRIDKDGNAVPLPSGSGQINYVLFSAPFELDKNSPKDVLEDDLGKYDPTKWKFFEYRPERAPNGWVEYNSAAPTIAPFFPGRAFFILVADPNKVIDSGAGKTVSTGKRFVIELKSGWNLIGTPFNFPVSRESLTLVNSKIPQDSTQGPSLRSYERGWNIDNTMEPWKGYALYVEPRRPNEKINLLICPIATTPRLGKNSPLAAARRELADTAAKNEWTIQISAGTGAVLDTANYVGARNAAAVEYDDFDLIEPPVIGEYVSVSVPNVNWSLHPMKYAADFRPVDQDVYEWPLLVNSNAVSSEVILEFKNLANLPSGYEAYLIDAAYGMARNLKSNPSHRLVTTANGIERSLTLLVGKPEALQKRTGGLALVPGTFELAQNFPNPFATQQTQAFTAIRYALPKPAMVTVEVYNMLGQKVRTLVNRQFQAADYYLATWNGRDETGKEVSSGVYVYRILAASGSEKFAAMKKLTLVK